MNTKETVLKFHRETSACWRDRCKQPLFADAHDKRAQAIEDGAELTEFELASDEYGVMLEVMKGVVR